MKLHLGCGRKILPGWVNVDGDTKEQIIARYHITGSEAEVIRSPETQVVNAELTNLPFETASVDEILIEAVLEHIPFAEESKVWNEMVRVLKPGGILNATTPDFDVACQEWLKAKDDWRGFWDPTAIHGDPTSYFQFGDLDMTQKWNYQVQIFFGNQSTPHQFHTNAYTVGKFTAILKHFGFASWEFDLTERWKGNREHMIRVVAVKGP